MAALHLTAYQRRKIEGIEKRSYYSFCKHAGHDPEIYAKFAIQQAKQEASEVLEQGGPYGIAELRRLYDRVHESNDLWEILRHLGAAEKTEMIDFIVTKAPYSLIDFRYLQNVAENIGLSAPTEGKPQALRELLTGIPTMYLWDNEFNAFVKGHSPIDNIPCVCIARVLEATVHLAVNVLSAVMVKVDGKNVHVLGEAEVRRYSQGRDFMTACRGVLDMAFGRSNGVEVTGASLTFSSKYPNHLPYFWVMETGARHFVWFHEYGHLLRGHLQSRPCHAAEFEADQFATETMGRITTAPETKNTIAAWLYMFSASITLALICALDGQHGPSETHPPARQRLERFVRTASQYLSGLEEAGRSVRAALNPTLSAFFGYEV